MKGVGVSSLTTWRFCFSGLPKRALAGGCQEVCRWCSWEGTTTETESPSKAEQQTTGKRILSGVFTFDGN